MTDKAAPRPRGRPPKPGAPGPRGGKGSTMTTRITGQTRAALEAEAAFSGRSIGQVAEMWLEQARAIYAAGAVGADVGHALNVLARFAKMIAEADKDADAEWRREATRGGWHVIVDHALPLAAASEMTRNGEVARTAVASAWSCLDAAVDEAVVRLTEARESAGAQISGYLSASWMTQVPGRESEGVKPTSPKAYGAALAANPDLINGDRLRTLKAKAAEIFALTGPISGALQAFNDVAEREQAAIELAEFTRRAAMTTGGVIARHALGLPARSSSPLLPIPD